MLVTNHAIEDEFPRSIISFLAASFLGRQYHTDSQSDSTIVANQRAKMASITPFKIDVPDAAITKLKAKLELSDLPDEVDFSNDWNYGAPRDDILRLTKYWKDGYDWRAHEAKLNAELPQFKTTIHVDGFGSLRVHFVHKQSPRPGSIPLLFCHGCTCGPSRRRPRLSQARQMAN